MPEISRFLGIVIAMFYNDHAPPHFHAQYGGYEMTVNIENGMVTGDFPKRARKLVLEWRAANKHALMENWIRARMGEPLLKIEPLE